jgi:hypothetical protein
MNRSLVSHHVASVAFALSVLAPELAGAQPLLRDQSDVLLDLCYGVSTWVAADDFVLAAPARLQKLDVWLGDTAGSGDSGGLEGFGGTLAWGVFEDDAGIPGGLLHAGSDASVELVDSGLQASAANADVARVRVDLELPTLAAGTYWIALHEGTWGSAADGSDVCWVRSASQRGAVLRYATAFPQGPWSFTGNGDLAFVLYGDAPLWDQSGLDVDFWRAGPISDVLAANDFTLGATTRVEAVDLFLTDAENNDNNQLDGFGGTLGWGLFDDDGGVPGSPLASGQGTPQLVNAPFQAESSDVVRARLALAGLAPLPAGTYWLAIREGAWGTALAESPSIFWIGAGAVVDESGAWNLDPDAAEPWTVYSPPGDGAFALTRDPLFASGFEAGKACAWSAATGGVSLCP